MFIAISIFFFHEGEFDSFDYIEQKKIFGIPKKVNQENINIYHKTSNMSVVPLCLIQKY